MMMMQLTTKMSVQPRTPWMPGGIVGVAGARHWPSLLAPGVNGIGQPLVDEVVAEVEDADARAHLHTLLQSSRAFSQSPARMSQDTVLY